MKKHPFFLILSLFLALSRGLQAMEASVSPKTERIQASSQLSGIQMESCWENLPRELVLATIAKIPTPAARARAACLLLKDKTFSGYKHLIRTIMIGAKNEFYLLGTQLLHLTHKEEATATSLIKKGAPNLLHDNVLKRILPKIENPKGRAQFALLLLRDRRWAPMRTQLQQIITDAKAEYMQSLKEELQARIPEELQALLPQSGNAAKWKKLIYGGLNPDSLRDPKFNATPLIWSVEFRAANWYMYDTGKPLTELLLKHGCDPNAYREDGATPLALAALNFNRNAIKLLAEYKTDMNFFNPVTQETALHSLTRDYCGLNAGFPSAAVYTVNTLIECGADPNVTDPQGVTPLMLAAMHGPIEVVKALLKKGAQLNTQDTNDLAALDYAKNNGQTEIAQFLAQYSESSKEEI